MSLSVFTICPKCAFNNMSIAASRCFRCVNGSKFEPKLDEVIRFSKELEEVKEKEKMFVKNLAQVNDIKVTFNGRECNVSNAEIKHPGDPRELPTITLECVMTRSAVPYNEYASKKKEESKPKGIKNVIFNPPATIVFWEDGTKTVVKAENEDFDPEKGLAMAITKKVLGNKGNYFETVKKWTKDVPKVEPVEARLQAAHDNGAEEKWAEIEAKLKTFSDHLVVGNRVTKKFYNEFLDILMPDTKEDEA